MSRRLIALGGALILVLGLAAGVTQNLQAQEVTPEATPTAPAPGAYAWDRWSSLTDEQKVELQDARNEMLESRVQLLEKQVELGLVDPKVADYQRQRIEWMKEAPVGMGRGGSFGCPGYRMENQRSFGRGGRSAGRGPAMGGWGMMGPGW